MTFAARDFSPRRGVSDEHIPQWICEERATKSGRKRPAALRVAPNLACGFVARRLQPHGGDAPSSRLATGQIGRNERHRIYASDHLATTKLCRICDKVSCVRQLYGCVRVPQRGPSPQPNSSVNPDTPGAADIIAIE